MSNSNPFREKLKKIKQQTAFLKYTWPTWINLSKFQFAAFNRANKFTDVDVSCYFFFIHWADIDLLS